MMYGNDDAGPSGATSSDAVSAAGGAGEQVTPSAARVDEQGPLSPLRVVAGCALAWAVPGLGHVVLGRAGRGAVFAAVILALFVGGVALDGKVYAPVRGEPLTYLAALGAAGVGVPFVVAHVGGFASGRLDARYHDYGNTFTLVAGLLNLLVVLDAYDVATRRR